MTWRDTRVAPAGTHHLRGGSPLYDERFDEVLKYHAPGLAPVRRGDEAWHIKLDSSPTYAQRFRRTFGFYEGLAAVIASDGWHHIHPDGSELNAARYDWCGNFQSGRCAVREDGGKYLHIIPEGQPAYAARWRYAGDFRDGVAVVQAGDGRSTHIDPRGDELHGIWFLDLDVFHKGYARARDDDGWTHIDSTGRPLYSRRFAAVEPFYNGQARVERFDGGLEVIDESGHTIQELRAGTETDLQRLSGLMVGFWRTQVVRAAAELRIIDHLPGEVGDVANQASLSPDGTRRLLRALWELGLVERREQAWTPTPMGELLRSDSPSAMADAAKHWGTEHYAAWAELAESLATGEPGFDRVYGQPFFLWLAGKPRQLHRYHRAMRGYAVHDYEQLHEFLPLDGVRHVVDAGGGSGALLSNLIANRPDIAGTLLDLPEVIESSAVAGHSAQGVRRVGADIFEPWPCKADLVVLARVLHDWDDDHARVILECARAALEPGGRIALVELVLTEEEPNGSLLDLNMLAICGARERTATEWKSLAESAGLEVHQTTPLPRYGALQVLTPRGGTDA